MPVFYCKQEDFEGCPYRVIDLEKGLPLCRYLELTAQLIIDREFTEIPSLTSKACDWIKEEEFRLKSVRKIVRENGLDVVENANIGDMLFCLFGRFQGREVRLLEKPSSGSIFTRCQAFNGEIFEIQPLLLRRIAKGNYCGEHFVNDTENGEKARELEFKAKYYGFRTEIERKNEGFLLKIFGDSQEQVNEFIFLVLEHDLDLLRFLTCSRESVN